MDCPQCPSCAVNNFYENAICKPENICGGKATAPTPLNVTTAQKTNYGRPIYQDRAAQKV
jgi:hypothetical protein